MSSPLHCQAPTTTMRLYGASLSLSPREFARLSDLNIAVSSGNIAFQDRALAAAREVVSGEDARFALAVFELEIGNKRKDMATRARALDTLIDSPILPRDRRPQYLRVRGEIAYQAKDFGTALRNWTRLAALSPDDPQAIFYLGLAHFASGDPRAATSKVEQAIDLTLAHGAQVSEDWYRQALHYAYAAKAPDKVATAGRRLLAAYPGRDNWRTALVMYRQLAQLPEPIEIDLTRLMRAAGVLASAPEHLRLAQQLRIEGAAAEAKAVIDEGVSRKILDLATSPTREIIREIDRALAAPKPDGATGGTARASTRPGIAFYQKGDLPGALAAFNQVKTDDPAAALAAFWVLWLGAPAPRL